MVTNHPYFMYAGRFVFSCVGDVVCEVNVRFAPNYLFHLQVQPPDCKKPKQLSSAAPPGAPGTSAEGEATASAETSKTAVPIVGEANGSDSALEKARAAFEGLQASVVENAQVCVLFFYASHLSSSLHALENIYHVLSIRVRGKSGKGMSQLGATSLKRHRHLRKALV